MQGKKGRGRKGSKYGVRKERNGREKKKIVCTLVNGMQKAEQRKYNTLSVAHNSDFYWVNRDVNKSRRRTGCKKRIGFAMGLYKTKIMEISV